MTIIPKIRTRFGENIGVEIFVQPPDLGENEVTFLNLDTVAISSSYSVDNGLKFGVGEYIAVLPGSIGAEKAEINQIHASTPPTASTITLASTSTFSHSRGERIVSIPYNQVIIEKSTDGISYSTLATINLRIDSTETVYADVTGLSTYYYRARFSNSSTGNISVTSDAILATGYVDNSAGQIIRAALLSLGEKIDGEVITKEELFQWLHEGREEIDNAVGIEKWSFRIIKDAILGTCIPGRNTLIAPTNLREPSTFKNMLSLRVGRVNTPLIQADTRTINQQYRNVAHSTLNGPITSGSTSIILSSSGDFDESGSVDIAAENVDGTVDNALYTGNSESTSTLNGVTSIADSHATARDVWQNANFGIPTMYTIDNGIITFSQPLSNDLAGENIKGDYYAKLTRAASDGSLLDEPWAANVYIPYVKWRIRKRKDSTLPRDTDPDFMEYKEKRDAQIIKSFGGQDIKISYYFR